MQFPSRVTVAASCVALLFAAACSDSTGPATQSAASLAVHFDSLAMQAAALGDGGSGAFGLRAAMMTFLEIPVAFGAVPTTVAVATSDGVEHWKGVEILDVASNGTALDSEYVLVAYRDPDAHTFVFATFADDGAVDGAAFITNDSLLVAATPVGATSRSFLGAPCDALVAGLQNPFFTSLVLDDCTAATFATSLTLQTPSTPNVDPAFTNISLSAASFSGIRVTEQSVPTRRVRALLKRLTSGNRL
jgi:hypothetical protein